MVGEAQWRADQTQDAKVARKAAKASEVRRCHCDMCPRDSGGAVP